MNEWYAWRIDDDEMIVPAITDKCNELSRDGYELVTTAQEPRTERIILIFRRPSER